MAGYCYWDRNGYTQNRIIRDFSAPAGVFAADAAGAAFDDVFIYHQTYLPLK